MAYARLGIALHPEGKTLLDQLSTATDTSHTAFFECLLFGLTEDEAKAIVVRGTERRSQVLAQSKALLKQARERLKNMSPDELARMVEG